MTVCSCPFRYQEPRANGDFESRRTVRLFLLRRRPWSIELHHQRDSDSGAGRCEDAALLQRRPAAFMQRSGRQRNLTSAEDIE